VADPSHRNENRARIFNFLLTPQEAAEYFCSLYRQRVGHICKVPGRKRWQTWRGKLEDFQILAVIADGGRGGIFRGCHWADETRFAVLDIDARSQYHNQEKLAELSAAVKNVGLKINLYQSSDSGGWHLYIPLAGWQKSPEVEHTFKRWLKALGYEIKSGQLEVFPSGNALRLPLQPGFAWLAPDGSVIRSREETTLNEALACFIEDLEENAQNWQLAKHLMDSQVSPADRAAGSDDQAHQEAVRNEGFDELFNYTVISEYCEKARQYLASGLIEKGTRHEALFTIQHLLWHGDRWLGVPRLPGRKNAARRHEFLRTWIEQNHNGQCSHINQGDWRTIEAHIYRLVNWQRSDLPALSDYERYKRTEKAEERLFELFMATGRVWEMEDLKRANDKREEEARAKIKQAVSDCLQDGRRVSRRRLQAITGCSPNTLRKHDDLWRSLSNGSGVLIRGGTRGLVLIVPYPGSELEEEKEESPAFEIEISSGAGCVLDSLRYDRTGQTATNSRQVTTEVLAAVHPIQSNSGVKHELAGSAPCVASGGIACGINGFLPTATQQVPSIYSSAFFSMGAPAQNLRQVGNRCDGCVYNADRVSLSSFWLGVFSKTRKVDVAKAQCWLRFSAGGCPPLSCYDKRSAGGMLLSSEGYMVLGAKANVMSNESPEKPEHRREQTADSVTPARGEITNSAQDYTDQVKAERAEQKIKGQSKATGAGADAFGKGGLVSAKDLLGEDAHGITKAEKQAALLAQIEQDGYIVGNQQDKPVLIAEKPSATNQKLEPKEGQPVKLETVLSNYRTPFTEAFEQSKQMKKGETGKLEMLEETMRRLHSVPWKEKLDVNFDPKARNPEYNPVSSVITINTKHGTERQIEEFVHEGFHATHQGIGALYINKAKPVSSEDYFNERANGEVGSFIAEIKVNAELKNPKPVEFEHVVNGESVIVNLSELYKKHGEEGLRTFLLDAKPVLYNKQGIAQVDLFQKLQTGETYREHYEKSYKTYVNTFDEAKPQAGAVLKEYQKRNPGRTSTDFIQAGY
jgi:hypothetical protein